MTSRGENSPHDPRYLHELTDAQRAELDRIEAEMRTILNAAEAGPSYPIDVKARYEGAIDDEQLFIRRFGFDWPRSDRIAVIEMKQRLDLTDREIRLLQWTGNLKRKHGVVTLASARWAAIFGRCVGGLGVFRVYGDHVARSAGHASRTFRAAGPEVIRRHRVCPRHVVAGPLGVYQAVDHRKASHEEDRA